MLNPKLDLERKYCFLLNIAGNLWTKNNLLLKEIEAKAVNLYKKAPKQYIFIQPFAELYKIHDQKYKYRITSICVNKQLKKLIQIVLQALKIINPDRANLLEKTMRQPDEINKILKKPTVKSFLESMNSCPFFSSDNFTFLTSLAIEKNSGTENHFKNHIIARTLQVDPELGFDDFMMNVRKNLFIFTKAFNKYAGSDDTLEIETLVSSSSRYNEFKKFEKNNILYDPISYSQNTSFASLSEQKKFIDSVGSSPMHLTESKNWSRRKIPDKYDSNKNCTDSTSTLVDSKVKLQNLSFIFV